MKSLLLAGVLLFLSASHVIAQFRVPMVHPARDVATETQYKVVTDELTPLKWPVNTNVRSKSTIDEYDIGNTLYDLQSNNALSNRFYVFDDGTMGAVWTMGIDVPPGFPDRGTAYNFFDGTSWGPHPTLRVETMRTGWPSYAPLGANGEIIISHDFASGPAGLLVNTRPNKGTGTWTQSNYFGPTGQTNIVWPRMTTAGIDNSTIHLLALTRPTDAGGTTYQGMNGALLYSRSTDEGATWDIQNIIIPGLGSDSYPFISADEYVWANPRGDTIAFVVGSKFRDLVLMKSHDNGSNWTKTVIWEHPYPMWDWNTTLFADTLWTVDGSFSASLDEQGMAHVVFALTRISHPNPGTSFSFWPYSDGIAYWNESMGTIPVNTVNPHWTLNPDSLYDSGNLIGWTQDVDGNGQLDIFDLAVVSYRTLGISTMPTISVGENNTIYVIFSSVTEGFNDGVSYYRKLWGRYSPDGGTTWGNFTHLTDDLLHLFDECIYPQLHHQAGGQTFYFYQTDESPGLAVDADHGYQTNLLYFAFTDLATGFDIETRKQPISEIRIFPNPASQHTTIAVHLNYRQQLTLNITDARGRLTERIERGFVNPGIHIINLNTSAYEPGIYFTTIATGGTTITDKLIVAR